MGLDIKIPTMKMEKNETFLGKYMKIGKTYEVQLVDLLKKCQFQFC